MKTKTIILNGENGGRGISSIFVEDDILNCRIRTYGISDLTPTCKIGIFHNDNTYTANLIKRNGAYISSLTGNFDINKDFYIALIETEQNNKVVLKGGTYGGYFSNTFNEENEDKLDINFDKIEENCTNSNINFDKIKPNENNETINFDKIAKNGDINKEDIEKNIDINLEDNFDKKCENCVYKKAFFDGNSQLPPQTAICSQLPDGRQDINDDRILKECTKVENVATENKVDIDKIVSNFNEVLKDYPADETLNKIVENGKFVKINENLNEYSIGALFDGEKIRYLCYAKKCRYNEKAPEELGEHYQWIPLDKDDPLTDGYNIVFQDITDLKIIDF